MPTEFKDLVLKLLKIDPKERLGSGKLESDLNSLKQHSFFNPLLSEKENRPKFNFSELETQLDSSMTFKSPEITFCSIEEKNREKRTESGALKENHQFSNGLEFTP